MKRFKIFILVTVICLITVSLFSCSDVPEENTIEISSTYPNLKTLVPGEYDKNMLEKCILVDGDWNDYSSMITVQHGKLTVIGVDTLTTPDQNTATRIEVSGGAFIGIRDHLEGYVKLYNYAFGEEHDEFIIDEACVALIRIDASTVYLVTASSVTSSEGYSIYLLKEDRAADSWTKTKLVQLPGAYDNNIVDAMLSSDGKTIYVTAYKAIYSYNIEDNTLKTHALPDYWINVVSHSTSMRNMKASFMSERLQVFSDLIPLQTGAYGIRSITIRRWLNKNRFIINKSPAKLKACGGYLFGMYFRL